MYDSTKPYKYKILKLIKSTWQTPHVNVDSGTYPIIKKKFSFPEVQHTDGIGTKGIFHWQKRTLRNAVLDALTMNLNDLAMIGAIPYALQNHIVLPKDDHAAIIIIIRALTQECRKRKIAITGGETSIHSDVKGLDISITVSGFVKYRRQNKCRVGDILIGLKSNGLHSNGITKLRETLRNHYRNELTRPTKIYFDTILSLLAYYQINGMMHITGGAFSKLKDILVNGQAVIVHPKKLWPQKIFFDIYKKGVTSNEMYSTFNCGIGFVLSAPPKEAQSIISRVKNAAIIGKIISGNNRITIQSAFDDKAIKFV